MSAELLPLTAHRHPDAIVARRPGGEVTLTQFLGDVATLAEGLPGGRHILNVCQDRYRFMVGLAAGIVADKVSLLPSSHTPEAVRRLQEYAADVFCLHDGNGDDIDLPKAAFPALPPVTTSRPVPEIPAGRVAAVLLTSGSTGTPVPHAKTWGGMVRNGRAEAERLGLLALGHAIVGTVPAQHSYGLESTVLLTLLGNCSLWAGRPFYPADIAAALASVPRPRLLVTTPFHLRTLLDAEVNVPSVDMILSATAPLSEAAAREAEARLHAPVHEIYGCTETGQLASRRTIDGPHWTLLRDVVLEQSDGVTFASGGHVPGRQALGDILELKEDGGFVLHGRNADMVNIAGKRTSLAYLNLQVNSIPQVRDAVFYVPDDETPEGVSRLCAFVVAPTLSSRQLLDGLRERIDPIFLPRPLVFVDQLPRNTTGKLVRKELQGMFERHVKGRHE
ncbi:MAG TPA: AMP-binding protein [Rhodocyclaceae bacterium]|nr:AMP-binding protein [Rhodocyclaceae bacterium]